MPDFDLDQINSLFADHFKLTPPLDPGSRVMAARPSEFGSGASLGNGLSADTANGLDNIQVFQLGRKDQVASITMQAWLAQSIQSGMTPNAIGAAAGKLLQNGQLSYFEQSREFATRLQLDPETNRLKTTAINRDQIPAKPRRTFGQWVKNLFGKFNGPEADAFNRSLMTYEMRRQSLVVSDQRANRLSLESNALADGKGLSFAANPSDREALDTILQSRIARQNLPEGDRMVAEREILSGGMSPIQAKAQAEAQIPLPIATARPNISPAQHKQSVITRQTNNPSIDRLRSNLSAIKAIPLIATGMTTQALLSSMGIPANQNSESQLKETEAFKSLVSDRAELGSLIERNGVFDQFAKNLVKNPEVGTLIGPTQIRALLNHCIEPHEQLTLAVNSPKPKNIEKPLPATKPKAPEPKPRAPRP